MSMKQFVFLLWFFWILNNPVSHSQNIGSWRAHQPYHQAIGLVWNGSEIFAATPYSIFSIDPSDNSISTYSKVTGLSESGVTAIGFDSTSGKIVVAYESGNLDIILGTLVKNVDALKRSNLPFDKRVYKIICINAQAYLCTGLGIVVLDLNKYEIRETYVIGENGVHIKVNDFTSDGTFYYAATQEGLKQAAINSPNLADFRNWNLVSNNILNQGAVQSVVSLPTGEIIVHKNDSLFRKLNNTWSFIYTNNSQISSIRKAANQVLVTEISNNVSRIRILNGNGSVSNNFQGTLIKSPKDALLVGADIWFADSTSGLGRISGSSIVSFAPNSPQSIAMGEILIRNSLLYATSGFLLQGWRSTNNKNGFFIFSGSEWQNYTPANIPALDSFPDLITIAEDPRDQSLWIGSFGGGLLQFRNPTAISVYKQNSPLQSTGGNSGYNISGLAFDINNNLWVSNYGVNQNIHVRKSDGTWRSFVIPFFHSENAVSQIVIDDFDQKWIVSPANGLFLFNDGGSIDNPGDDRWKFFRSGKGNGNLPTNNVLSIAKDKNNFIWVGTSDGLGVIQCTQDAINNNCEAVIPVILQGNFNGFLFGGEQVQAIAVDGANRKWIGTKNGAWLISADGEETIHHFTIDNSPLLSDDVRRIAIDGKSGEVFFSTSMGICSFRGTATEGGTTNSNVLVFPNPIPPGYSGTIAIRGLVNNAIVKITELNGRLVYQGRALGGQAVWNGRNYQGERIASGVYLVLVTDESGKENLVTKIVIIK